MSSSASQSLKQGDVQHSCGKAPAGVGGKLCPACQKSQQWRAAG